MKVGITFSCFDLLHAGHVSMLREAKQQCDYLVAGLQLDPTIDRPDKNFPIQTIVERYTQLKAIKYVDEIIPYTTEKDIEDIYDLNDLEDKVIDKRQDKRRPEKRNRRNRHYNKQFIKKALVDLDDDILKDEVGRRL